MRPATPVPPPLDDAERAEVEAARMLLHETLDDLRPRLLTDTGAVSPRMKGDGTPVTSVDVEVNEQIVKAIAARFPDHGVISEELDTAHHGAEWTWVVDPVDGTSNYTAGLPYWCISVALTLRGNAVLAIVDAPPVDTRFEAVLGEGARRDGRPVEVRPPVDLDDPRNRHIPLFLTTGTVRRARPRVRLNPRVMGSAALDLCLVADGTGAAAISLVPKVWDIAAGALMVIEAGGTVKTLNGDPLLPLEPGVDYAGRSAAVAAGATDAFLARLTDRLNPADEDIFRR